MSCGYRVTPRCPDETSMVLRIVVVVVDGRCWRCVSLSGSTVATGHWTLLEESHLDLDNFKLQLSSKFVIGGFRLSVGGVASLRTPYMST
jgi:hypothetical protein